MGATYSVSWQVLLMLPSCAWLERYDHIHVFQESIVRSVRLGVVPTWRGPT